jgi:hypothetical protein
MRFCCFSVVIYLSCRSSFPLLGVIVLDAFLWIIHPHIIWESNSLSTHFLFDYQEIRTCSLPSERLSAHKCTSQPKTHDMVKPSFKYCQRDLPFFKSSVYTFLVCSKHHKTSWLLYLKSNFWIWSFDRTWYCSHHQYYNNKFLVGWKSYIVFTFFKCHHV